MQALKIIIISKIQKLPFPVRKYLESVFHGNRRRLYEREKQIRENSVVLNSCIYLRDFSVLMLNEYSENYFNLEKGFHPTSFLRKGLSIVFSL